MERGANYNMSKMNVINVESEKCYTNTGPEAQ